MAKINIGTCVPGQGTEQLLPHFIQAGFECVGLNFHMVFTEESLPAYAEKVKRLLGDSGVKVSSIGYYCNALENEAQRKTLEDFIDNAHLFGTNLVTTFATGSVPEFEPVALVLMIAGGIGGGIIGRALSKRMDNSHTDKLLMGLMVVIMGVCVYNMTRFLA